MLCAELERAAGQDLPLSVEFADSLPDLESLADTWRRLEEGAADHDAPFFQSYAWCRQVAKVRAARSPESYRILVAIIKRGPRIIGILPLSLQRTWRAWIARMLDDPYGQFAGALFERSEDVEPGVAAVLSTIREEKRADAIFIDCVIAGTPLARCLAAAGFKATTSNAAPVIDMRKFATYESFTKTLNAKTRKNLRNTLNRANRNSEIVVRVIADRTEQRKVLADCFKMRLAWLNTSGKTSPAFRDGAFLALAETLAGTPEIALRVSTLEQSGRVLARQWGVDFQNRYYAYMSSREADFQDFSVGRLHLSAMIEDCFAVGIRVAELMPPAADYKMTWANMTRSLTGYALPLSANGWLVLSAWQGRVYPALHKASRSLPVNVRKQLALLMNGAAR